MKVIKSIILFAILLVAGIIRLPLAIVNLLREAINAMAIEIMLKHIEALNRLCKKAYKK